MSSYTFKNLLIVERGTTNDTTKSLVEKVYGAWFDFRQPFEYHDPQDKIVIFYEPSGLDGPNISQICTEVYSPRGTPVAMLKLLCDKNNIKITHLHFKSNKDLTKHMKVFREYLLNTIKLNTNTQLSTKYTVYWKKEILDQTKINTLKTIGLVGGGADLSHTFTDKEIAGGAPEPVSTTVTTTSPYVFNFGGTTPGFSFPSIPVTPATPHQKPASNPAPASTTPVFSFPTNPSTIQQPTQGFSFTPPTQPTPTQGFGFTPPTQPTPGFGFTPPTQPTSTQGFGFTPPTQPTPTQGFGFTPPTQPTPTQGFGFTPPTQPTPTQGFGFTPPTQQSTPAFGGGFGQSKPAFGGEFGTKNNLI